jgi:amidohydrolase
VARALGGDYALTIIPGCPSTYNDPRVAGLLRTTAAALFGAHVLTDRAPSMGGEDFSYMTDAAPGAMFMLGARRDAVDRPHHNPHFDVDEQVFPMGTALLAEATLRLLHGALATPGA